MRRTLTIALLVLMALGLAACADNSQAEALDQLKTLAERLSRQESNRADMLAQLADDPGKWEQATWQENMDFETQRLYNVRRDLTEMEVPPELTLLAEKLDNALAVCEQFITEIGDFEPENMEPTIAAHPDCLEAAQSVNQDALAFELP